MAVCGDKRVKLQNQIDECEATMMSLGDDAADEKGRLQAKLHGLHEELQDEEERRKRWTVRVPSHRLFMQPMTTHITTLVFLFYMPGRKPAKEAQFHPPLSSASEGACEVPILVFLVTASMPLKSHAPRQERAASFYQLLKPLPQQKKTAGSPCGDGQANGRGEDEHRDGGRQEEVGRRQVKKDTFVLFTVERIGQIKRRTENLTCSGQEKRVGSGFLAPTRNEQGGHGLRPHRCFY